MLAGVEPDGKFALADAEIVELLSVERLAERPVFDIGVGGDGGDEIVVPLHRIRREIGEPDAVRGRRHLDGEDAIIVARFGLLPIFAVVGEARAVVFRSEEHTSELQSLMRSSYAVFCLKQNTLKSP